MSESLLKISDLTVQYALPGATIRALDHVSLDIPSIGYTLGIVGESGSGKTTMGLSILGLIEKPGRVSSGSIKFEGRNILEMSHEEIRSYRGPQVSMIYQSAMNSLSPTKTILGHVEEVIREHSHISKVEAREKAIKSLASVGIKTERVTGYPHEFSGGMRQRVVIAMALALSPKMLIADEPTSALDVVVQRQILDLIRKEIEDRNLSLVFVTHEIPLTRKLVDHIAVMYAGEVVETGPLDRMLKDPLHPYSEMLIGSLLTLRSNKEALARMPKESSESKTTIATNACKFANRCKYAFDRCRTERPLLKVVEEGRLAACHKYN
ncbi:MAG: ABC transporter ATP-binding protein [Nitrososphaerales archaeon]